MWGFKWGFKKEETMLVGEFCNREVIIVDRATTILEAAKLMRSKHVGDLVVTDRPRRIGGA